VPAPSAILHETTRSRQINNRDQCAGFSNTGRHPYFIVFYFGEDSEEYEDGVVVSTDGSWRAGVDGAQVGILMPGTVLIEARHYQELAPDVAMDRSVIVSLDAEVTTPAGFFTDCLKTVDSNPLEPAEKDPKYFAPGVDLIKDEGLELLSYGTP